MADPQSNAPLRAPAGAQASEASMSEAPASGVIHVRTRLAADFTVIANSLLQRPGSAVTVGVAGYILSLPDGASVSIDALCEHFTEGEILISRALRDLESDGYLRRLVKRGPVGRLSTRTFFYDVPPADRAEPPRPRTAPRRRRAPGSGTGTPPAPAGPAADGSAPVGDARATPRSVPPARATPAAEPTPENPGNPDPRSPENPQNPGDAGDAEEPEEPGDAGEPGEPPAAAGPDAPADATGPPPAPEDPRAVVVLASLRLVDRRLILSARETAGLAPAVGRWLARGVEPADLTAHLTDRLPARLLARPARILAHRLRELPPPLPEQPAPPPVLPMVTCDGCGLAFRSAGTERCRGCRQDALAAAC
ncbi:hypothetical protein [Streptomyces genisteinicus]|uniref:Helix-turn-helix domain-containing protein n=1 Tax=Streptomyces genisteinicus TaxID=2768068 RepID=A0A7H0HTK7_9ACTN|nr:hypothetical protein [Streptomyces genisteinicus]QNP63873.1 hypothetical protein IAG43_13680 [Streptomyces genisteinicus]